MHHELLVITGNPGVGKHTVARMVARKLGMRIVDISKLAIRKNAIIKKDAKSYVVDPKKLASLLRKELDKDSLVVGHLAPYVLRNNDPDIVVVIRRSPYELKKVYAKRRYNEQKTLENLSSEAIGVCLYDSLRSFGRRKVAEVDATSRKAGNVANEIISLARKKKKPSFGSIDWLSLIVRKGDMQQFFEYNDA